VEGAAVLWQPSWRFLTVDGVGPQKMLNGILSGRIPEPLLPGDGPWRWGTAARSAALTPRGKMITDLRISPKPGGGFLLDLPSAGLPGLMAHFKKFINPRFATVTDPAGDLSLLTVVGPGGAEAIGSALGLESTVPRGWKVLVRSGSGEPGLFLLSNSDVQPPAFDLIGPPGVLEEIRSRMEGSGARALDQQAWEVLRIEAGTPLFGVDMTEDTIPVEAGIQDQVIDYGKGCYTGQEVIIRLRDRGRVNKHLRRVLLGDMEPPPPGTPLFPVPSLSPSDPGSPGDAPPAGRRSRPSPGEGVPAAPAHSAPSPASRKAGWITSACVSPRFGQTVALGYLKRGVGPGEEVRVGDGGGPVGLVEPLP
jgi:folate-binding protein YgfZ